MDAMHNMNFKMKKVNDSKVEARPIIRPQKSTLFESPLMKYKKQINPVKISEKVAENFKSIGLKSDVKTESAEQKAFNTLRSACRSSSGYTKIMTQNKTYDWIVENIRSFRPDLSDCSNSNGFIDIRSPTFSLLSDNDTITQWHLFIRFGEFKNNRPSDHASIWLMLENFSKGESTIACSDEQDNIKACFEIRIMNDSGKVEQILKSGYRLFTLNQVDEDLKATWGFSQFIPYSEFDDEASRLFTGDKLRIKLELKIYQGSVNFPFPQKRINENRTERHGDSSYQFQACSNDYGGSGDHFDQFMEIKSKRNDMAEAIGTLWKNDQFADVEIVVRGQSFPAHKAILTARSRVFSKMFSSDSFSESQDSIINLDTLSPSVVENMLQYIYTDSANIPKDCDDVCELLEAAEMYELFPLKYDCYYELIRRLEIANISKIVVIAYHYRPTDEIMAVIKEYLHCNLEEVIATRSFGEFFKQFKQAFVEILSPEAFRNISSLKQ